MVSTDFAEEMFPFIVVPPAATTLEGFREWVYSPTFPKRGRINFVGGALFIDMRPEAYETHLNIKGELGRVVAGIVKESKLGEYYCSGVWITHRGAALSVHPDAVFAAWETLECGKLGPPPGYTWDDCVELVGTPDWVCEIVSDMSVAKDTELLVRAYHKAGIREYWLVDVRNEKIDFQVLVWTEAGYQAIETRDGWRASPVFGCELQLIRFRNEAGRWAYDLRQRRAER
jgi:Uma2 family endonuclease